MTRLGMIGERSRARKMFVSLTKYVNDRETWEGKISGVGGELAKRNEN